MKIEISNSGESHIAVLSGEIDHHNAREIREELDRYIMTEQPKQLEIDFSGITFMDSSGIGLIMGRHKMITEFGGVLVVKNPHNYIRRVLKLSGIERLVKITSC